MHDFQVTELPLSVHNVFGMTLLHCRDCGASYYLKMQEDGSYLWKPISYEEAPGPCVVLMDTKSMRS